MAKKASYTSDMDTLLSTADAVDAMGMVKEGSDLSGIAELLNEDGIVGGLTRVPFMQQILVQAAIEVRASSRSDKCSMRVMYTAPPITILQGVKQGCIGSCTLRCSQDCGGIAQTVRPAQSCQLMTDA